MNDNLIHPPEGDPSLPGLREFWLEQGRGLVKESLKAIEDTARQVIAVSGILEGLYFHAIAYTGLGGSLNPSSPRLWVYLLPLALLLISLAAALLVFLPQSFDFELRSWEAAQLIYRRTLRRKLFWLRAAAAALILALGGVLAAVWVYLTA